MALFVLELFFDTAVEEEGDVGVFLGLWYGTDGIEERKVSASRGVGKRRLGQWEGWERAGRNGREG